MLHVHHVNLQPIAGGGEVYTRALTRALADAGAQVSLYANPAVRLWDDLAAPGIQVLRVRNERELLDRLPREPSLVLTQSPISPHCIERMAERHRVAGFAHMPMIQRSVDSLRGYHLVITVSRYCVDLLRATGLPQVYPEPFYGMADIDRVGAAVIRRSPYMVDRRKFRDVLIGGLDTVARVAHRDVEKFERRPGLTLGLVSLIAPIKQFPALFSILAPILARQREVTLEIFGAGGYAQVRDLRRALAPLGNRARFWGYQTGVGKVYPQLDYLMTGLPEKEALGLNVLEAQSCGTPVLAPDAPPFTETVLDGASGYLYRDPRTDAGRHFENLLAELVGGRARPDPRISAREHLAKFSYPALVERARALIAALSQLE
ncbi:MAG: glycosyltransferase family 4 protein [Candidatus Parcubacteria bacterium]|nr:glycosyltransferase family 4 protein [Burkholderiales bacterium]